jgi:hypothetical protein
VASALQPALVALVAKLEAITPQDEPTLLFRRKGKEKTAATTRAPRRLFDLEFDGLTGSAPFRGCRVATVRVLIDYPVGRAERELEAVLALDSEDLVRALTAADAWDGDPVLRVAASTTVDRTKAAAAPAGTGLLQLVLSAEITYPDAIGDP